MRMIKVFRTSAAFGAILLGALVAASASAAGEPQIAGYCWVTELTSRGTTLYQSSTFQKDSAYYDRDRWIADFKTHLREKGVNVNNYACRLWKGNAEALEGVRLAKEGRYDNLTTVIDVAWAPNDTFGGSTGRPAPSSSLVRRESQPTAKVTSGKSAPARPIPTSPQYVEVAGPDGKMIRLSPEVAARNKAAEEEYQRKIKAHAEVIAQAERDAAKHAQSVANAAAEKREYERQLAANAAQVAAHKAKMENYKNPTLAGGSERTFQATSKFRATREEAMYEMTSHPRAPISNVQCKEVTFYKPARWTCWGTYQQAVSQSSTSKQ